MDINWCAKGHFPKLLMKKTRIIFALIGGLIGLFIHYNITHVPTGVSLLSIGPHAIEGTIFTLIGMIIGMGIHSILPKR